MGKTLELSALLRDQEVASAWAGDKLERRSAHSTLRTIVAMIESAVGPQLLERSELPASLRVMRLQAGERRKRVADGFVIHGSDDELAWVIPPGWRASDVFIVNHTIDRCAVGASALAFCMASRRQLFAVH